MSKDVLIEFEKEGIERFDKEQALDRFSELYRAMKEANSLTCMEAKTVKFDLNYLFADVLECLNILTFTNLSKVIGTDQAGRIWGDAKTQRE